MDTGKAAIAYWFILAVVMAKRKLGITNGVTRDTDADRVAAI
jgi:hypothetical protein